MIVSDETATAEEKTDASAETAPTKKSKGKNKKAPAKGAAKKSKDKGKKAASAKKAKAPKKEKAPKKPAAERDEFGFRKNSKKSEAAKLYATKKGATLAEVKDKTGSSQLNLLKELEEQGYKISKTKEAGEGKKQVTRYKIETKGGGKSKKSK